MKDFLNRVLLLVVPYIGYLFIKLLEKTMRISYINFVSIWKDWQEGKKCILAFWHGRLSMMPLMYRGYGITVLVSQHRDGELISRTVKRFNIESVRGSSTRGWLSGVKGLLKAAKSGRDLAITPDGPKGPRCKVQSGIINIAKATGLPIVPVAFSASKKKP
ncbi:MAG: hypothetical protein A2073_04945 [Deltaproteobacteria bacterium GWC2_42_11]|nr:MAG: hypothetical protein A2073_04945 [Deltaproteobacteria bacterium GWC2_42_11]